MKRRDFLINSAAALGGCTFFSGCKKEDLIKKEGEVIRRKFKDTSLPMLGFGGSRYPMKNRNEIDVVELDRMIEYAINHGVNLFDTAYFYINHQSEIVLGEILKKYERKNYFISDKLPIFKIHTKEDIRRVFDEQLKKCGTDYFDFYMPHGINTDYYNTYKNVNMHEELLKLKQEGKIKYLGFSFHGTIEMLKEIVNEGSWDCCQLQLNYYDWKNMKGEEQYKIAQKANIPVIVMEPLRGGKLVHLPDEAGDILKKKYPDIKPSEFGLRWAGGLDNVITVLSGMSNLGQVKDNVAVFENFKAFSKEEQSTADEISNIILSLERINCTSCNYCISACPKNIDIPKIFSIYNNFKITNKQMMLKDDYETIPENQRAHNCTKCGLCVKNCTQGLKIPELLARVQDEYEKAIIYSKNKKKLMS